MKMLASRGVTILHGLSKRSTTMSGGALIFMLIVNGFLFFPFLLFVSTQLRHTTLPVDPNTNQFFYTIATIVPTLAVVSGENGSYTAVPLSDIYADDSTPQDPAVMLPRHPLLHFGPFAYLRTMMALRLRWKGLTIFRGLAFFAPLFLLEFVIAVASLWALPPALALVPQVLVPLPLAQLYCLWTYTILTYPSKEPVLNRVLPFKLALRATGPALTGFLLAKAVQRTALYVVGSSRELQKEGHLAPRYVGPVVLTAVATELLAILPARLVLTRIQASLLPEGERTVVQIDGALQAGGKDGGLSAMGVLDAWRTFTLRAWLRLLVLYVQIIVVVVIGGGVVLLAGFVFNLLFSFIVGH
jgi:hypothetical protein